MEKVKSFFSIETPYHFEWNDLRCGITILNVVLIMLFGLQDMNGEPDKVIEDIF